MLKSCLYLLNHAFAFRSRYNCFPHSRLCVWQQQSADLRLYFKHLDPPTVIRRWSEVEDKRLFEVCGN